MYVYLQAYQPDAQTPEPLYAFVTFYKGGAKVFETAPLASLEISANRLKTTPLRFRFPLSGLDSGEYLCQVTVLDTKSRKAAFWQAPVMLVP